MTAQALRKLRERVGTGEATTMRFEDTLGHISPHADTLAEQAYFGSLDAAMALHEALLPGWGWEVSSLEHANIFGSSRDGRDRFIRVGVNDNPARAWLLAILDALIQEAGE